MRGQRCLSDRVNNIIELSKRNKRKRQNAFLALFFESLCKNFTRPNILSRFITFLFFVPCKFTVSTNSHLIYQNAFLLGLEIWRLKAGNRILQIVYKVLSFPHKMLTKLFHVIKGCEVSEYEEHSLVPCDTV
jgi:hypothetical protein